MLSKHTMPLAPLFLTDALGKCLHLLFKQNFRPTVGASILMNDLSFILNSSAIIH